MASTYWIEESLPGILPTLWIFLGLGLPWALAALSTRHWRAKALVTATALALGPAWVTAWMLLLGVVGAQADARLLTAERILAGSAVIAAAGGLIAWRKGRELPPRPEPKPPFAVDEKLIIGLIAVAIIARWLHTAFFPFTAYDALWVFGYQGRLFFLEGVIPNAVDYYPPFLSLQFAGVQALIGEINDHAARMVIPMLHIGSVLAAYALGERLVNRRVGLMTAALWSLHPYVGRWALVGDLEIPLAFSFTLAAFFFLSAWRDDLAAHERRHAALLAGVMLGVALFTKPTAGAFVWGVLLLLAIDLVQARLRLRHWRTRLRLACWAGLACLPLGAVWYLRNLALGHEAITLPKAVWLTRALRNGDYLAPLLVAALLAYFALALHLKLRTRDKALGALGIALLLAGALASNARLFPERVDPPASYVQPAEAAMMAAGVAFGGFSLRGRSNGASPPSQKRVMLAGLWALLLALPYFVTYFFSYSYHYRLGFAIVPLLCLPSAIALSRLLSRERIRGWSGGLRRAYYLALCGFSLPGLLAAATDFDGTRLWLLNDALDSDLKKYQRFNPSLMEAVGGLEAYARDTGETPIVLAPGSERLPFFFPQWQIIDQPATRLAEYEALGATHFVYWAKTREAYQDAGLDPLETQMIAALGRIDLFETVREHFDGTLSYQLYESRDLGSRRVLPPKYARGGQNRGTVVFDERLRLRAHGAFPAVIFEKTPITLELNWQALQPLESDLEFVLRLERADSGLSAYEWTLSVAAHRHGEYSTRHWETDEFVYDRQVLRIDRNAEIERRGQEYVFTIGVWDPKAARFLPLTVDGASAGQFYQLPGIHKLRT